MNKISIQTFKHTLKDIHNQTENRKFCFILGAGSSFKSGIPTGGKLAKKWYDEIAERYSIHEFDDWKKQLENFNENELASHYGDIYRKRFESDKASGYEFLVQAMKNAKPTFGHVVLSQILTKTKGHSVITTNFDSLVETAIYQFTDKTPLVCGHESLSGYARPSDIHPLIIKVHRDLLLAPKSDPDDIHKLAPEWKDALDHLFSNHIPIVIGYGGNDGSLMTYFEKMNKPSNFFWCELKGIAPPERAQELVAKMDGNFIEIDGFDEIMHEFFWVFDEIKPIKKDLEKITKQRITTFDIQLNKLEESLSKNEKEEPEARRELSAFEYDKIAEDEPDFEKRKTIYLEALEKHPNTSWLWSEFTYFLHFIKKDYYNAEKYYKQALIIEPNNALQNGNYAIFLHYFKKDYKKAEIHYIKALQIEPSNSINNGNYANLLCYIKKDYKKAEKYYIKALEVEPNNVNSNGNYANFLRDIKKDHINAEKYYIKALEIEPDNAINNGNYAQFLLAHSKKKEGQELLDKAFELNKKDKTQKLYLELWFYRYAHFYNEHPGALKEIENLLEEEIQSIGWCFDENIKMAIKGGHPHSEKLKALAKRITEIN